MREQLMLADTGRQRHPVRIRKTVLVYFSAVGVIHTSPL